MIKNQDGQAAIEFILVFVFAIAFVFLFAESAINAATGYVQHYATFMSARTFQSHDTGRAEVNGAIGAAAKEAEDVFEKYGLEKFGIKNKDFKIITPEQSQGKTLYVGATSRFKKRISVFEFFGGGKKATYLSEAFLGKEPVRYDCMLQICAAMGISCDINSDVTLFDNGC